MFHFFMSYISTLINKFYKITLKIFFVYLSLIVILTSLLVFACSIPDKRIRNNIKNSLPLLESEGDYPIIGGENKNYQLDNFTDSIILNIIYNIDSSHPIESAFRSVLFKLSNSNVKENIRVESLKYQIDNNVPGNSQYTRYWHGYIVFLRPLLIFTTYSDIRKIYEIIFLLFITIIIVLISKKISMVVSILFSFSLAILNFLVIPFSLQYSSVFFIAFISTIIILLLPNIITEKMAIIFFIIGACTSFTDLLTTPMITFGLPALILVILRKQQYLNSSLKTDFCFLIYIGVSWIIGYALLWISKWVLASVILNENIINDGSKSVYYRTWGVIPYWLDDGTSLAIHALTSNFGYIYNHSAPLKWLLLYIIPIIYIILFIRWHREANELNLSFQLFVLAIIPYAWYIIASNHSAVHCWFTNRIQIVTVLSISCAMYFAINIAKMRSDFSNWLLFFNKDDKKHK